MDKQIAVEYYAAIKKNEGLLRCNNVDESWKHAKWKKPVTKDCILYDSTNIKCPE